MGVISCRLEWYTTLKCKTNRSLDRTSSWKERKLLREMSHWKRRRFEFWTSRRKSRSLKSSNSCWITRSKSWRETLDLEKSRSRNSTSRLTRCDRNRNILTGSTKTWCWSWMIWECGRKGWRRQQVRWKGSLLSRINRRGSSRMTSIRRFSRRSKTSRGSRRAWSGYTKCGYYRRLSVMLARQMHTRSIRLKGTISRITWKLSEKNWSMIQSITQRRIRGFWKKTWLSSKKSIISRWSSTIFGVRSISRETIQMQGLLSSLHFPGLVSEHRVLNWW